ncbi:MAG TPA: metallophosphoesterase family protein [Candidatus Limnocylindria bacterium]
MRVALLSDIHANLVALEAVLAAVGAVDALWVTGDTVGYGAEPSEVLALLRERGAVLVQGNHDRGVATGEGLDLFHERAAIAARMHAEWLNAEERDALAALPQVRTIDRFTLCHGSLRDPLWEYVTTTGAAAETIARSKTALVCCGHTHVPIVYVEENGRVRAARPGHEASYPLSARCLLNPGSVGQPRDGDKRASYVVLDTDAGTATFHRASYRVDEAQRRIRARGLPEMFAERLAFGL